METVDRVGVAKAAYPALLSRKASGAGEEFLAHTVTTADEYPFPTNPDADTARRRTP